MKYLLFLLAIASLSMTSLAKSERVEVAVEKKLTNHSALLYGDDGIIVYSEKVTSKGIIKLLKVDKNFKKVDSTYILWEKPYNKSNYGVTDNHLYIFLYDKKLPEYKVIKVNAKTLEKKEFKFKLDLPGPLQGLFSFRYTDTHIYMLMALAKQYTVAAFNTSTETIKYTNLEGNDNDGVSARLRYDPETKTVFSVYLKEGDENNYFVVHRFSKGRKVGKYKIKLKSKYFYAMPQVKYLKKSKRMLLYGAYNEDRDSENELGYYMFQLKYKSKPIAKIYPYSRFKGLPKEKDIKVYVAVGKKRVLDTYEYTPNFNTYSFKTVPTNTGFYHISTIYYFKPVEEKIDFTVEALLEKYSVGVLVTKHGYDGKLLWQKLYRPKIEGRPTYMNRVLHHYATKSGNLNLIVYANNEMHSQAFSSSGKKLKVRKQDKDYIQPEGDIVKEQNTYIGHWYGNYFLHYGYQYIKNSTGKYKKKRHIYYFIKNRYKKHPTK